MQDAQVVCFVFSFLLMSDAVSVYMILQDDVLQMRQDPREAWLIAQKWPSTAPVQPHPRGKDPRDFMPPTVAEVAAVYKCVGCTASCLSHLSQHAGITQQACKGCTFRHSLYHVQVYPWL